MLEWQDVSSRSQSTTEEERSRPKSVEALIGGARIGVTRRFDDPGAWYGYVHGSLEMATHRLDVPDDIEVAKVAWAKLIYSRLAVICDALRPAPPGGEA